MQHAIKDFMEKVKRMEKGENLDLSSDEDLSIGVMNLISIEEHLFFTYGKTQDAKYLSLLHEVREMRKNLMKRMIKDYEGEVWCISKHLLASSMRLMEVGTKALTKGNKKDAEGFFQKSFQLYSLFWGINLGLISDKHISFQDSKVMHLLDDKDISKKPVSVGLFAKLGEFVQKAVDCCKE